MLRKSNSKRKILIYTFSTLSAGAIVAGVICAILFNKRSTNDSGELLVTGYSNDYGWQQNGSVDVSAPLTYAATKNGGYVLCDDACFDYAPNSDILPAGLILNQDGSIVGVPAEVMTEPETITVWATCESHAGKHAESSFTVTVSQETQTALSFAYSQDKYIWERNLSVNVSAPVVTTMPDNNRVNDAVFSLINGSSLPSGVRLLKDGSIVGVPIKANEVGMAAVQAISEINNSIVGYDAFTWQIGQETQKALSVVGYDSDYGWTRNTAVSVGAPAVTTFPDMLKVTDAKFSLFDNGALPTGVILNEDGIIVGTPTKANESGNAVIQVTSESNGVIVGSVGFTWSVAQQAQTSLSQIGYEDNYSFKRNTPVDIHSPTITTNPDNLPVMKAKFELMYGTILPEGLQLNEDGSITGTPTVVHDQQSSLTVIQYSTNEYGNDIVGTKSFSWYVHQQDQTSLYINGYGDHNFTWTQDFSDVKLDDVKVTTNPDNININANFSYAPNSPKLPEGLTLIESGYDNNGVWTGGTIVGKPTELMQPTSITIRATDPSNDTIFGDITITVAVEAKTLNITPDASIVMVNKVTTLTCNVDANFQISTIALTGSDANKFTVPYEITTNSFKVDVKADAGKGNWSLQFLINSDTVSNSALISVQDPSLSIGYNFGNNPGSPQGFIPHRWYYLVINTNLPNDYWNNVQMVNSSSALQFTYDANSHTMQVMINEQTEYVNYQLQVNMNGVLSNVFKFQSWLQNKPNN